MKVFVVITLLALQCVYAKVEVSKFKSAAFSQKRFLKSSGLTLNSSGKMSFEGEESLIWQQTKPFSHTIMIEDNKIYTIEDQKKKEIKNPVILGISAVISDLLKGNYSSLEKNFTIVSTKSDRAITLTPKEKQLKKFLRVINLKMDGFIQELKLEETSGNFIQINFSKHTSMSNK